MARRFWVIGAGGVAVLAFASASSACQDRAATAVTTPPESTIGTSTTTTRTPDTKEALARLTTTSSSTSTSTTSTSTTSTTTSTTTPTPTTSTTATTDTRPFDGAAFDAVIAAATVDVGDISAGASVIRNGTVLHTASFGMENPFESILATSKTRFRLASVSKMLTSVAIMQLVDEGAIKLDEPFAKQMHVDGPFADPRVATITVRQLLSHMSGFSASHGVFFGHGVDTWQQAAQSALGQVLKSDPGTAFQYSNTNFCMLGLLLESVTGQPFEAAIRERVLKPIGIKAHLAPTFDTVRGDALHASASGRNYMEALGPAGGWVATPTDVAMLAAALRDSPSGTKLLDATTVGAMRVRVPVPVEVPPPANGWSYGLGLMLFADGSWGHTGTIESTHSVVVNRPDGLTVSLLISGKKPFNTDALLPMIDLAVAAAFAG